MRIRYPDNWSRSDCDALDRMFSQARAHGLWFYHNSLGAGEIWVSPDELQSWQEKGHLVWGAVNWKLRKPQEYIASIDRKISELQDERRQAVERALLDQKIAS